MRFVTRPLVGLTLLALVPLAAQGQEGGISTEAAANMARNCFACHGPQGRSPGPFPVCTNIRQTSWLHSCEISNPTPNPRR